MKGSTIEARRRANEPLIEHLRCAEETGGRTGTKTEPEKRGVYLTLIWLLLLAFCLGIWVFLFSMLSTAVAFFKH